MRSGELVRVRVAFGALGAVPVFLAGWLAWVQVAQAGAVAREDGGLLPLVAKTADRQGWRAERVPAPRGSIVDRHGHTLAADCAAYEVRARVAVPSGHLDDAARFRRWLARLVDDLSRALVADPELERRDELRREHADRIAGLLGAQLRVPQLPADGAFPDGHPGIADVLVSGHVDRLAVVEALRRLGERPEYGTVTLHFLHSFRRVYPDRDLTYGIVGHCDSRWERQLDGRLSARRFGVCGLESFVALDADEITRRRFLADGRGRPYFVAPVEHPPVDTALHTTLDLELQRIAVRELARQAEAGTRTDPKKLPKWGALVLVELATGDLLAAASWHRDAKHPKASSFTPYQARFEPGSIVKPLVLAYAHEVGVLDWSAEFDCSPGGGDYRARIAGLGRARPVRDDHPCGVLTPHGVLVNSSNIGAAFVGLMLEREQWRDWFGVFGFGSSLGLQLPDEVVGGPNALSFRPDVPVRSFRANSAISFSFGYELHATPLQVARAYLRLFRGLSAELRLCRGLKLDGEWHPVPVPDAGPRLRRDVVDAVRAAMVDVVSPDDQATGRFLHRDMLRETGVDLHGLIGGKTGTAASDVRLRDGRRASVRNASFVGFLPAHEPRWLAVCVLQKDDSARFYGASYAAPPAVRLLLQCQELAERRQLRQEPPGGPGGQTRAGFVPPGSSGWSSSRPTPMVDAPGSGDTRQGGR